MSIISMIGKTEDSSKGLDQSFMYTLLLKEILLETDYDNNPQKKFVEFCRQRYSNDVSQFGLIEEFELEYHNDVAIRWYTKDSFLYWAVNQALRTQDIQSIMRIGFFVRDLHEQIVAMHDRQRNESRPTTVYRGQGLPHDTFEKLKASKGDLFSFNSFLSTSTDYKIAKGFRDRVDESSNKVALIFEIKMDPEISSVPFAMLQTSSCFEDENEVLFSMHTVFRIADVKRSSDQKWQVDLILTNEDDPQLKNLTDYFRKEIGEGKPWERLGNLRLKLGVFYQA
jgi:hypothetical protein